jgi:hypothetical protein
MHEAEMSKNTKGKNKNQRSRMSTVDDVTGGRRGLLNIAKPTLAASVKHKYIVRSRHDALCEERFIPVNKIEAKKEVEKPVIHDDGEPFPDESRMINNMMIESTHGNSVFKRTSPIS